MSFRSGRQVSQKPAKTNTNESAAAIRAIARLDGPAIPAKRPTAPAIRTATGSSRGRVGTIPAERWVARLSTHTSTKAPQRFPIPIAARPTTGSRGAVTATQTTPNAAEAQATTPGRPDALRYEFAATPIGARINEERQMRKGMTVAASLHC